MQFPAQKTLLAVCLLLLPLFTPLPAVSAPALSTPPLSAKTSPQKVNLRLLWKHQFQFAGYYMAKEKGFYARRNLDVELHELEREIDNLTEVLDGRADFAVGRSSLVIEKVKGRDIVTLFAAFQRSPFMLLTRAFTGIQKPSDLAGKRIMINEDAEQMGELISMLAKAGLTKSDYIQQDHSFNIDDLINDKTDAMASYLSNEPYRLIQQGIAYNILHPADYGFEMYSDILYTSGKMLRENPQLVERFYSASIEGWQYAFANIPETVSIITQKYNTQNRSPEALLYEAQELKRLAFDDNKIFGQLFAHRFRSIAQIYLLTGAIDHISELDDFVYPPPAGKLNLSYEELAYIKAKQLLNVCVQQNWPPYEQLVEGKYEGILADFIHLVRDKTGLSIRLIPTESSNQAVTLTAQGICDLISVAGSQTLQSNALLASQPYIHIPLVQISKEPLDNTGILKGRVGIAMESPYYNEVASQTLPHNLVDTGSVLDGLKMLQEGHINSLIAPVAQIRYLMSRYKFEDLTLNNLPSINWKPAFFTNPQQPLLLSILNKTITQITKQDHDHIMSRWVVPLPERGVSISLTTIWLLTGIAAIIVIFFMYRYIKALFLSRILKELAETDQLTGIANRRKTLSDIESFRQMANRYEYSFSLIFLDIDDFKMINDQYGHATGDRILIELSVLIQKQTRKTDTFGRWGGEEFILVCPHADIHEAKSKASLIQKKVRKHKFKLNKPVHCSFGITQYHKNEPANDFINRADEAMYLAKQSGKDCIRTIK